MFPQFQDPALYKKAKAIREWLLQISGLIPRLNEDPNPYYHITLDGLTLVEYYGGPSQVGTPLGGWMLSGGGCCSEHWREEATSRLGLVLLVPGVQSDHGYDGPIWAITKDLDGNPLPPTRYESSDEDRLVRGVSFSLLEGIPKDVMIAELASFKPQLKSEDPDESDPYYAYMKKAWGSIKEQISFLAWDDRVDPRWILRPVCLKSELATLTEGVRWSHLTDSKYQQLLNTYNIYCLIDEDTLEVEGGPRSPALVFVDSRTKRIQVLLLPFTKAAPDDTWVADVELIRKLLAPRVHNVDQFSITVL